MLHSVYTMTFGEHFRFSIELLTVLHLSSEGQAVAWCSVKPDMFLPFSVVKGIGLEG